MEKTNIPISENYRTTKYGNFSSYVMLAAFLLATVLLWKHVGGLELKKRELAYEKKIEAVVQNLEDRLNGYKMILKGCAGLFVASEEVTRDEWRSLIDYREVNKLYTGFQSIGFSKVVRPEGLERHIQEIRAEGYPDYTVWPPGERDVYAAIVFFEPQNDLNLKSLGYDTFSEPVRRAAMERARDTGDISMSGVVNLVQATGEDAGRGFVIFVPVYANNMPLNGVEQKREAIKGFVYAAFRMDDFIQGVLENGPNEIVFSIYEGKDASPATLLYAGGRPDDGRKPMFTSRHTIDWSGHQWTLRLESVPEFEKQFSFSLSVAILPVGLVIGILSFMYIQSLQRSNSRAHVLALKMTDELRQSEKKYRLLSDVLPHGECVINPDMKTMAANAKMTEWFPEVDFETNPPCFATCNIQPKTEPCDRCPVVITLRDGHIHTAEREVDTSLGTRIMKISAIPVIGPDGDVVAATKLLEDITESRLSEKEKDDLQAQLIQAQKMEAIGRLAGGVAHDFNNMLSVIMGTAQLALMSDALSEPLRKDIQTIFDAGERSAALTRQLLAFARKQSVEPVPLILNDTISEMLKMIRRLIGEDIDLVWSPGKNLWKVEMDPTQIDQILANMSVNARDAIADTGKITIETENAALDEEYCRHHFGFIPGEYVKLTISDDGCGMDSETMENIFDPFFTTKEHGRGTGLGLATVHGIVKQTDGFINVYSEPGRGTTFSIYLPRFTSEETASVPGGEKGSLPRGSETVLIVEDEPAILSLGVRMLERLGYKVLAAIRPGEAISLFEKRAEEIHIVITDTVLPEMNGRELAERLAAMKPELKCIYMSGYTANVIAHHGVLEKGLHFIQKPFSLENLARKLREALDG